MEENREKEVMEAAIQAGHLLLENGAEISRVEETMERIFRYYGVESGSTFVLSNGIFATAGSSKESFFAKVEHIPVSGTHLNRVAAVNQLSREIEEGRYSPAEAAERLNAIRQMPGKTKTMQILASGCGQRCLLLSVWRKLGRQCGGICSRGCAVCLHPVCERPSFFKNYRKYIRRLPGYHYLQPDVSFGGGRASELHGNRLHYAIGTRSARLQMP